MRRWMQFSKKVIIAMIILWFAGALFGGYMVYRTSMELSSLLSYIGAPMAAGILGYLLKAAFENSRKEAAAYKQRLEQLKKEKKEARSTHKSQHE